MCEPAVVEQAKGVLMLRFGIGSYEALAVLQRWSRDSGESLAGLARAITHGICQGHDAGDSARLTRWLEQRFREDLPGLQPVTAGAVSSVV